MVQKADTLLNHTFPVCFLKSGWEHIGHFVCLFVCCLFRENKKLQCHTHCDMKLDTYGFKTQNSHRGLISILG